MPGAPRAKEHVAFALAKIGVERAARDTEGVTGRGQAVLVEKAQDFKTSLGIFGRHVPKIPQSRYPVKPPDAVADVLHLHGMPPGSEECQRFLSLCKRLAVE